MKFITTSLKENIRGVSKNCAICLWFIGIFLLTSSITRFALVFNNFGEISDSIYMVPLILIVGIVFDLFISLYLTFPLVLVLLFYPAKWKSFFLVRWITSIAGFIFVFGSLYLGVAEIIFFDEFSSRFNYVAVDYLIYPHEVFINIWDTYPVLTILIVTGILSLIIMWFVRKQLDKSVLLYPKLFRTRFLITLTYAVLIVCLTYILGIDFAKISNNRILNEIGLNGVYSFFYSGLTNELDYNQYYLQRDKSSSFGLLRKLLDDSHSSFINDDKQSIARKVTSNYKEHRYNIVLVLEESFGSNFIGTLHPDGPNLTPRFDSLIQTSLLFSNIYATGNRTVRGLEASLASFPPIPGRSIVKRPGSENVFSLSSILKGLDYNTVFLYGGLSYFDNFGHFASTNSFDRIIDELDFKNPVFKTIWGVSDEDLFSHALLVFDTLAAQEKPFFATMITVSNHSPYTYPKGRIPFDPEQRRRENAVRYADYAIGKFINDAKSHSYFDSTLFIFQADHGARVYGSEEIPLRSYEIPILFYNSTLTDTGIQNNTLGSQMDLAPTILDFLGIEYNSMFFGRSLLSTSKNAARVLMSHNRDVSLLKHDTLVVLNIQGGEDIWYKDSTGKFIPVENIHTSPLVDEAVAYYMTAYDMFIHKQLHPLKENRDMR